jgi:large subunit ribosomal protein L4
MIQIPVVGLDNKKISTLELSSDVFGVTVDTRLIHRVLKWYFTSNRKATASTKTRGEVSGGGKKPWRQKGTGRARVGSIRSPLWRHGGVIFGPRPRKVKDLLPVKVRQLALKMILSDLFKNNSIIVVAQEEKLPDKTKKALEVLKNFGVQQDPVLIVADEKDQETRAFRNLENVAILKQPEVLKFGSYLRCNKLITFPKAI